MFQLLNINYKSWIIYDL